MDAKDKTDAKERIEARLRAALAPAYMEIVDESASHAGHSPAAALGGTHFRVRIASDAFVGRSRLQRHRMVNDALKEEFARGVHALAIDAWALGERT